VQGLRNSRARTKKRPFGGPEAVLAYLSRYTHRVAISNSLLLACDGAGVAFKYKNYRVDGHARQKVMRLVTDEFIRRLIACFSIYSRKLADSIAAS
jgi:hypothetical protein